MVQTIVTIDEELNTKVRNYMANNQRNNKAETLIELIKKGLEV